jgi:hypothetical protein
VLQAAEDRYVLYLELLLSLRDTPTEFLPLPPWDVALILHAHLLSPLHFANDFSKPQYAPLARRLDLQLFRYASRLQNLRMGDENSYRTWRSMYPNVPFQLFEVAEDVYRGRNPFFAKLATFPPPSPQPSTSRFGLNLAEAVIRQWEFSKHITENFPHDPVSLDVLDYSKVRYLKFMALMQSPQNRMIVPTLDVDLFWHTHQLSSVNYNLWCRKHFGRPINHDDTITEGTISNGLEDTKRAWNETYHEDYLAPTPASLTKPHNVNPKVTRPPSNLTRDQKELWDFDIHKQKRHEEYQYIFLQLEERNTAADLALTSELAVAEAELSEAQRVFEVQYYADIKARAAALGRPGRHPDMPIGFQRRRDIFKGTSVARENIHQAHMAQLTQATWPQLDRVAVLKQRLKELRQPIEDLIIRYNQERINWRIERLAILRRTGGMGAKVKEVSSFWGTKLVPYVEPVYFPLYAATWYGAYPLGAYNYSRSLEDPFEVRQGKLGYLCGTHPLMHMDSWLQPLVTPGAGFSCGSG